MDKAKERNIWSGPKDYLSTENQRNKDHGHLFEAMVRRAFGEENAVLIGHHITFEADGRLETENEIPSADTLIFDHEIMTRVFPDNYSQVMMTAAGLDLSQRDDYVQAQYEAIYGPIYLGR